MTRLRTFAKIGSPGFGVSGFSPGRARAQMLQHAPRRARFDSVLAQHGQRVGESGAVRRGRPRRDGIERIADHVGEDQRDDFGRLRRLRESPALQLRQVLAHGVDFADVRAARQERLRDRLLVRQRHAGDRQRHQRRAAAAQAQQHQVAFAGRFEDLDDLARAAQAGFVRDRMPGLMDVDPPQRRLLNAAARLDVDPAAGDPLAEDFLQRAGHLRRRLARADDEDVPHLRQVAGIIAQPQLPPAPDHVPPHRFSRVGRREPGLEDCEEVPARSLVHGPVSRSVQDYRCAASGRSNDGQDGNGVLRSGIVIVIVIVILIVIGLCSAETTNGDYD